jgi:hypothetical protein
VNGFAGHKLVFEAYCLLQRFWESCGYNETIESNDHASYCIIHQLFLAAILLHNMHYRHRGHIIKEEAKTASDWFGFCIGCTKLVGTFLASQASLKVRKRGRKTLNQITNFECEKGLPDVAKVKASPTPPATCQSFQLAQVGCIVRLNSLEIC